MDRSTEPLHVPIGLVFRTLDTERYVEAWAEHARRAASGAAFAPATLYVHVPFCARVCTYCLLSAVRTPGRDLVAAYVGAVRRQIALYEPIVRGLRFGSVHLGGGTPTILNEQLLDELLTDVLRLPRSEHAQIGVEAHPATSTPERLAILRKHGVHRLSFGVESLTPLVLQNVNREDQNEPRVQAAVAEARRLGFAVNIDLLAGLPGESEASWDETVHKVLALEADSLSVNRFLSENSPLARFGFNPDGEETSRVDRMLLRADALVRELAPPRWPEEPLARAGFGTQYVWDRSSSARRYFQDDMIGPVSTLALGHGALGHVYGRFFSVSAGTIADYVSSLENGQHPRMLAANLDERFEMAFFVADQACRGQLTLAAFQRIFHRALEREFGRELDFLLARGLLAVRGDCLQKPPNLGFQVTHLLAFLLHDAPSLAGPLRSMEAADDAPRDADCVTLDRDADIEALIERYRQGGAAALHIDAGDGLGSEAATRLAKAASRSGLTVEVRADDRRATAQYRNLEAELPPSMLWVRIAIRASQASRGEQRLIVKPAP